jgi:hypothetical protein
MNITRENYEAYFLDYHEGALAESLVAELMDFLAQNPDLQEEFDSFEMIILDHTPAVELPDREELKKSISLSPLSEGTFEEYCIAMLEGDLDQTEELSLLAFMKDKPELERTFRLLEKIKHSLSEKDNITFQGKSALKKFTLNPDKPASGELPSLETVLSAYHEGDLDDDHKRAVLSLIATDGEAAGDFILFKKAKVQPEREVIFPDKASLKKHIITPVVRQFWFYASAAAILAFMVSLFFLLPRSDEEQQIAGNNSSLMTREPEPQLPPSSSQPPLKEPEKDTITTPSVIIPDDFAGEPTKKDTPVVIRPMAQPVFVAEIMPPSARNPFAQLTKPESIEQRTEFAYWSARTYEYPEDDDELQPTQSPSNREYTSFASLAYSGIERVTGINVEQVEENIAGRNLSLWDLAGAGLAGISQLTGTSLTIDKDRDENGRITYLAIGDNFRISR